MSLSDVIKMSADIASSTAFAEGISVSFKDDNYLYVSAADAMLTSASEASFVKFEEKALRPLIRNRSSECCCKDAMEGISNAVCKDSASQSFTLDTLIHAALPGRYSLRVVSPASEALVSSAQGPVVTDKLFGEKAVFIDKCRPCSDVPYAMKDTSKSVGIFAVRNCGLYITSDSKDGLTVLYLEVLSALDAVVRTVSSADDVGFDRERASYLAPELRMLLRGGAGTAIVTCNNDSVTADFISSEQKFMQVEYPHTFLETVYCGVKALFVPYAEELETQQKLIAEAVCDYKSEYGRAPIIVAVENTAVFAFGISKHNADTAMNCFRMSCAAYRCAFAFGGSTTMPAEIASAISCMAAADNYIHGVCEQARLNEKIVVVTGAAQGFGQGIANCFLEYGCNLVIADLNYELAMENASAVCARYGRGKAIAVKVNVSDEDSVHDLLTDTVMEYGGIDLFVSNAGIARSGNIEQTTKQSLEFHIAVNYTGFYLCSKYASRIMKIQNRYDPAYSADIVQINSKSGLEGSNKNFAYAGSKFGSIGLVQSFALEFVEYNIKVNAVCPGNFLDGPLWSDPVKGLFVQYLNSGKVPGAKTVEDVRKFYESKVPMSRGCLPSDVAIAVIYCTEQKYETGQAIPVSGGQIMLK